MPRQPPSVPRPQPKSHRPIKRLPKLPPQLWLGLAMLGAALVSALYSARRPRQPRTPTAATRGVTAATPASLDNTMISSIEAATAAARAGNLTAYLEQFTDPLRGQLERTRAEKGDAYLIGYLKRLMAPVKGVAVNLRTKQDSAPNETRLMVEFIYADRNEVQPFFLRRVGEAWRISRMDSVHSTPILIPFGTSLEKAGRASPPRSPGKVTP